MTKFPLLLAIKRWNDRQFSKSCEVFVKDLHLHTQSHWFYFVGRVFFSCYTWNSMEAQKAIYKTIFLVMWFKPNLMICIWNEKILHQHSNWWVNAWCKSQNIFISMLKTSQPLTKRFVIFHPANFPLAFSEHMYLNSNTELSLSR